ncbi:unnamed protein product, partial [marine sediment metagenome]
SFTEYYVIHMYNEYKNVAKKPNKKPNKNTPQPNERNHGT